LNGLLTGEEGVVQQIWRGILKLWLKTTFLCHSHWGRGPDPRGATKLMGDFKIISKRRHFYVSLAHWGKTTWCKYGGKF
jgi:hypothetical protein